MIIDPSLLEMMEESLAANLEYLMDIPGRNRRFDSFSRFTIENCSELFSSVLL